MNVYNLDNEQNLEHINLFKKGGLKTAVQNVKTKVKTATKKAGETIKTAVKSVKDEAIKLAKKGANAGLFIPLLPLRVVMVTALKRKGVSNPPKDIGELAHMFYTRVVKGQNTYSFDESKLYNTDNVDNYSNIVGEDAIIMIVKEVIAYIKKIRAKKEAGEPLNSEEQAIEEIASKEEEKIENTVATADAPKNWFKDNLPLILIVGAVIVFLVVRKK